MSRPATSKSATSSSSTTELIVGGGGGGNAENVRVVVRCRPLSRKEADRHCKLIVEVDTEKQSITVINPNPSTPSDDSKSFTFDNVFPTDTTQADVYNEVARPIVENVLQGYNGTILAYGQTGTGKTYTMEGVCNIPELKGIIPNSFAQIFAHIAKAEGDQNFLVACSYLEIYNEDVRDLLSKSTNTKLEVKEHKDKGVYVKDLSSFVVRNADDMDRIMGIGNKNRSVASTNMNSVSSRSHAIFTITVECSMEHKYTPKDGGRSFRRGKLNLVDLAGSERLSKTQATGDRLKEATKINLSLSNLGNVISALVDGSSHVPYRNSKLTRLLQDSLGGNAKTVMVANVGPADYNYDETVSTLRFANRAKNIRNHAVINEDPKDALLRQFEKQIQDLRKQLEEELASFGNSSAPGRTIGGSDGEEGDDDDDSPDIGDEDGGLGHLELQNTDTSSAPNHEALLGIKDELENHAKLNSTIGNESQDRKTVMTALKDKVMTWKETEEQKLTLQHRLKSLQRKILVGGENLLDKSQAQEELLLRSMKEISLRKEQEIYLQQHLAQQEEDRQNLETTILNCQEQNMSVSKKLKKVWNQYQHQKNELSQVQLEYQEETDGLMDEVHKLSRELQYHNQIIDNFIPPMYQKLIEKSVKWQPDGAEWSLKCVAYAGNNMTRGGSPSEIDIASGQIQHQHHHHHHKNDIQSVDLSNFYLDIMDDYAFQEDEDLTGGGGGGGLVSQGQRDMINSSAATIRPSTAARNPNNRSSTRSGSASIHHLKSKASSTVNPATSRDRISRL